VNIQLYETRLLALPCVLCLHMGIHRPSDELHHAGDASDRDDWNQVPLCRGCHQGPNGIHGLRRRGFEARYKLTEMKLLAMTRRLYAKEWNS
jgi:hypothetical protein